MLTSQDEVEKGRWGDGLGECCLTSEPGKDHDNVGQVPLVGWAPSEQWAAPQSLWALLAWGQCCHWGTLEREALRDISNRWRLQGRLPT